MTRVLVLSITVLMLLIPNVASAQVKKSDVLEAVNRYAQIGAGTDECLGLGQSRSGFPEIVEKALFDADFRSDDITYFKNAYEEYYAEVYQGAVVRSLLSVVI